MTETRNSYGILSSIAPELRVQQWVDQKARSKADIRLAAYPGVYKVIYCFQAWCPGCHSEVYPLYKKW